METNRYICSHHSVLLDTSIIQSLCSTSFLFFTEWAGFGYLAFATLVSLVASVPETISFHFQLMMNPF
jgi:hypothetical protein